MAGPGGSRKRKDSPADDSTESQAAKSSRPSRHPFSFDKYVSTKIKSERMAMMDSLLEHDFKPHEKFFKATDAVLIIGDLVTHVRKTEEVLDDYKKGVRELSRQKLAREDEDEEDDEEFEKLEKRLASSEKMVKELREDLFNTKAELERARAEKQKMAVSENVFHLDGDDEDEDDDDGAAAALKDEKIKQLQAEIAKLKEEKANETKERQIAADALKRVTTELDRQQNFVKLEDVRKEILYLTTGGLLMFLFRQCVFLHQTNMKQEAVVKAVEKSKIVGKYLDQAFKLLCKKPGDKKSSRNRTLPTHVYCFSGKHLFDNDSSRKWLWESLGLDFVKKFCQKRNQIAFTVRNLFDVWRDYQEATVDELKDVLRCCLRPRTQEGYESTMHDVFANMCFMESSRGIKHVKFPFVTKQNEPATGIHNKPTDIGGMSIAGYETLNAKPLSYFLFPTEETFCCLTLSKYILYLLKEKQVDTKEFLCPGNQVYPVTPFQKTNNSSYTQQDRDFFYKHMDVVQKVFQSDMRKEEKDRTFKFDFHQKLPTDDTADGEEEHETFLPSQVAPTAAGHNHDTPSWEYDAEMTTDF